MAKSAMTGHEPNGVREHSTTDERRIKSMITDWAKSIERQDRRGILAGHSSDVVMIDFPNTVRGIDAYAKTWDFFDDSRRGNVTFEPHGIEVTAGDTVAFAFCDIHCDGTTAGPLDLRLTVGLVKGGDDWVITHEHHSVPTENEVLVGPGV